MDYELISAEEFDKLLEDDEWCFIEFETICRRNMTQMLEEDNRSGDFYTAVRGQYMAAVYSVAQQCGIPNIPDPRVTEQREIYESYSSFALAVQGEVARIRVRNRKSRGSLSVQLTENTRTKIQHYISRLRETIQKSDLPEAKKIALLAKLNELEDGLGQRRLSFGKTMAILSVVVAGLSSATTIAAEGPSAITHIMQLIGVDKESEEAALSRLASPPKALPAPPLSPLLLPRPRPPRSRRESQAGKTKRYPSEGGDRTMHNDDRPFSGPFGYSVAELEITVWENAPKSLRAAIVMLADNLGLSPRPCATRLGSLALRAEFVI